MRAVFIALLAAGLSGAAWAGTARDRGDCEPYAVSADAIAAAVQGALDETLAELAANDVHDAVLAEVEAEMDSAMAELDVELAALDGELEALTEAQHALVEARIDAALERMEIGIETGLYDGFEPAGAVPDAPKRWRPLY